MVNFLEASATSAKMEEDYVAWHIAFVSLLQMLGIPSKAQVEGHPNQAVGATVAAASRNGETREPLSSLASIVKSLKDDRDHRRRFEGLNQDGCEPIDGMPVRGSGPHFFSIPLVDIPLRFLDGLVYLKKRGWDGLLAGPMDLLNSEKTVLQGLSFLLEYNLINAATFNQVLAKDHRLADYVSYHLMRSFIGDELGKKYGPINEIPFADKQSFLKAEQAYHLQGTLKALDTSNWRVLLQQSSSWIFNNMIAPVSGRARGPVQEVIKVINSPSFFIETSKQPTEEIVKTIRQMVEMFEDENVVINHMMDSILESKLVYSYICHQLYYITAFAPLGSKRFDLVPQETHMKLVVMKDLRDHYIRLRAAHAGLKECILALENLDRHGLPIRMEERAYQVHLSAQYTKLRSQLLESNFSRSWASNQLQISEWLDLISRPPASDSERPLQVALQFSRNKENLLNLGTDRIRMMKDYVALIENLKIRCFDALSKAQISSKRRKYRWNYLCHR